MRDLETDAAHGRADDLRARRRSSRTGSGRRSPRPAVESLFDEPLLRSTRRRRRPPAVAVPARDRRRRRGRGPGGGGGHRRAPRPTGSGPAGRRTAHGTPRPAAALGHVYRESSCPDPDRGACFEPFPAGRYTFHKSNPQITITVGDGWRNDAAWPWGLILSRPDTPGASLRS